MPSNTRRNGFGTGLVLVVMAAWQTGCASESTVREDRTLGGDSGSAGEGAEGTDGGGNGGEDASGGRASGGRGGSEGSDGGAGTGGSSVGGSAGTADGGDAGHFSASGGAPTSGGDGGTGGTGDGGDSGTGGTGDGGEAGHVSADGGAPASGGDGSTGGNGGNGDGGGSPAGSTPAGGWGGQGQGGAAGHAGNVGAAGAPSSCGAGRLCVPPAPADWLGPVAVGQGSLPCSAAGGYPEKRLDLHSGILPGTPDCVCECAADSTTCRANATNWSNSICDDEAMGGAWLDVGSCVGLDCYMDTYVGIEVRPSGSCTKQESSHIPTPTWAQDHRLCGGASDLGGCGGGQVCLPEPVAPYPSTCVYREGNHDCPTEYPVRALRHQGFDDLRSCSECTCGALTGAECEAVVDLFSLSGGNDCAALNVDDHVLTYPADPFCLGCSVYDGAILRSTAVTDPGSCSPSGGDPTGSVVQTGATTLCCLP